VILTGLMVSGWLRHPGRVFYATLALMLVSVVIQLSGLREHLPQPAQRFVSFAFLNGSAKLFPCFLLGVVFYQARYRVPYHLGILAACLLFCGVLAAVGSTPLNGSTILHLVGVPVLLYIVVFAGLSKLPVLPIYRKGDYSYGIYLYHVPFLQAIVAVVPGIRPWQLFAVGLPLMTAVASLSWHFIEKPVLAMRKKFSFVARERGVLGDVQAAGSGQKSRQEVSPGPASFVNTPAVAGER
jgi:peptidoglycan/LPS O-acetylase OafA/YrhL